MLGWILAVQLGPWQELASGGIETGYQCILSVNTIVMDVQTTTFYGDALYQMTYSPWGQGQVDIGSLDNVNLWRRFLGQFKNKERTWAHLDNVPVNPSLYLYGNSVVNLPQPNPPVSEGPMKLLATDYSPLKGWWITFKGNFRLHIPVFQEFPNVKGGPADYQIKVK